LRHGYCEPTEIMPVKAAFVETLDRSEKLLEDSRRIVREYINTLENTRRLIVRSQKLRMRVEQGLRTP
jgi:hypothetical protein